MAIILDERLEAYSILKNEGRPVIAKGSAEAAEKKPLRVALMNLLPEKPQAETQWARGLSYSEYDIELTLVMVESHRPKHTAPEYLDTFYTTPRALKDEYYDGLIITGADAEKYPFLTVKYWPELEEFFRWADTHVNGCYFSCWGCMAALYRYHGVDKELIGPKLSGIYPHTMPHPDHPLMAGQSEPLYIPHSRISRSLPQPIYDCEDILVLAESERTGPTLCCCDKLRHVYIVGHWEYEFNILESQYIRDTSKGFDMEKPENYYDENGNIRTDTDWPAGFHRMMANWVRTYCATSKF